jgi:hypothetical protein
MKTNPHRLPLAILLSVFLALPVHADEREVTPEQQAAVAGGGDEPAEATQKRPDKLPDLTKGELIPPGKTKPEVWHLGPTGIVCILVGGFEGDQLQVQGTLKGSPAEGKFLLGDVITGMNGKKFVAGGHQGYLIGKAIIEAEKQENAGKLTFQVWRDGNYAARFAKKDVAGVDIDKLIDQARNDDSLYEWKKEEERKVEVSQMNFDAFPIVPSTLDVELKLRVMPAYSDTSPYDCPKTKQILEDAWKVLEKRFVADPKDPRGGKGGVLEAIALTASGKPEHRKLIDDWVRSKNSPWLPPTEPIGEQFKPDYKGHKGYKSWNAGFNGLNCALYLEATGDDFVVPALRKFAIETAMGQSGGGSWGHTFAYPSFNGGEFHRMNPGYGALNAAGNRCFFLIVLAKKLGVEHPEIDAAITRAHRFFGSYVDQGAIPYGDHGAAGTDDSNGKNTGVAFAMKLLGDNYGAKYFAQMSTHSAFTRRGGHGHDYHGTWSGWATSLCGPESVTLTERNMRWRRTLCRLHDGSFVYHSPTGGKYGTLRDPTATEVLHYSQELKQTLITGKDADESLWNTERDMKQLLASARPQFNDEMLFKRDGKPWPERGTDELFDLLDIFMPKARQAIAAELGKRFQAGEKQIAPRLVELLENKEPRFRDGALHGLLACGADAVLASLSKVTKLLDDPNEFIRLSAANVISKSTETEETQIALLQATAENPKAMAPNSLPNTTQALFTKENKLANTPFSAGLDEALVRQALESVLMLDPVGGGGFLSTRLKVWDKDTVVRLAGPLSYIAEEEQNNDQMFANRSRPAIAMLEKFGYREAAEASANLLRKQAALPRDLRGLVGFKRAMVDPFAIQKQPGAFHNLIEPMRTVLIDNPLVTITIKDERSNWQSVEFNLSDMLAKIEAAKTPVKQAAIADDARALFDAKLAAADGTGAKLKLCRTALADRARGDRFEKIAAMDVLTEMLEAEALEDLLPYLGHDDWRLRTHSRKLAAGLANAGAGTLLASALADAKDAGIAAGILAVFADSKSKSGLDPAKQSMKHEQPRVRQQAIQTFSILGGDAALPEILAHLKQATDPADLRGCEAALDARCAEPATAAKMRDSILAMIPDSTNESRAVLFYLLARIGDAPSIAALKKAAQTDKPQELADVARALSYSPSREVDQVMLDLAASNKNAAGVIAPHSLRRMVIGPKGYGDITSAQRMDFAEAMLKHSLDAGIIRYLGTIYEARALRALMFCLEKGVASAAQNLVSSAEGMEKLSPADSKIAAKALQDVIEYIEVTRLRGGAQAHMNKDDHYAAWKELQARAGKVLLKVHKPETAPIQGFDSLELDR